ncbi:MAG: GH1 family beta-glucosidase [Opitutus sp.]
MKRSTLSYTFPRNFVWGVATAAPQIEGATTVHGRGESIWDRFAATPGHVVNGDTPAIACDHYHRFRTDFALMRRLGIKHHRLSVAWPRIIPAGRGTPNGRGLDFYQRLIDRMLKEGITPWVTLYHWDLPQALEDEGGWRVRQTAEAFATYAQVVVRTLGDRVKHWITLNEIPCFIGLSYQRGVHAPGAKESQRVVSQAYHHALLAHGYGVGAVREWGGRGARVGLVHNPDVPIPVTETAPDIAAAETLFTAGCAHILAPIYHGRYPASYLAKLGADRPRVDKGDLALIAQPSDFLGLNVYSGSFVRAGRHGKPETLTLPGNYPRADLSWLNHAPQSMYWALHHAARLYGPTALYVTENGAGYEDQPNASGEIIDLHRRDYVRNHLIAVHRAIEDGLPVHGYFLWSFLDNFEWAEGYVKRFGIVYNDFKTQRRTPKLSARWYARVIAENRIL